MVSGIDKAALMAQEELLSSEAYMRHFRRVAFMAVALSTVTMLSCIVVLPLSYQYIQRVHSSVTNDLDFCRVSLGLGCLEWFYGVMGLGKNFFNLNLLSWIKMLYFSKDVFDYLWQCIPRLETENLRNLTGFKSF